MKQLIGFVQSNNRVKFLRYFGIFIEEVNECIRINPRKNILVQKEDWLLIKRYIQSLACDLKRWPSTCDGPKISDLENFYIWAENLDSNLKFVSNACLKNNHFFILNFYFMFSPKINSD